MEQMWRGEGNEAEALRELEEESKCLKVGIWVYHLYLYLLMYDGDVISSPCAYEKFGAHSASYS